MCLDVKYKMYKSLFYLGLSTIFLLKYCCLQFTNDNQNENTDPLKENRLKRCNEMLVLRKKHSLKYQLEISLLNIIPSHNGFYYVAEHVDLLLRNYTIIIHVMSDIKMMQKGT